MISRAPSPAIADAVAKWPAILRRGEAMRAALESSRVRIMDAAAWQAVPAQVEAAFKSAEDQVKFNEQHTEQIREMLKRAVRDALNAGDIPRTEIPKLRALGIMPQTLEGLGRLGMFDDAAAWDVADSGGGFGGGGMMLRASNVVGQQAGGGESGLGALPAVALVITLGLAMGIAAWLSVAIVEKVAENDRLAAESQSRITTQAAIVAEWQRNPTGPLTSPPVVVTQPTRPPLVNVGGGAAAGVGMGGVLLAAAAFFLFSRRKG